MLSLNDLVDALLQPQQDCPIVHPTVKAILAEYGYFRREDVLASVLYGDGVVNDVGVKETNGT